MNIEIAPKSTETKLTWEEAMFYCQFLNHDGGGWRLPTIDELNYMYLTKTDNMQYEDSFYWSFTEPDEYGGWILYFDDGEPYKFTHSCGRFYVRAIRDKS